MNKIIYLLPFILMFSCMTNTGITKTNKISEAEEISGLFWKQKKVLSLSECEKCIVRAYTVFETNPDKKVLLKKDDIRFTKPSSPDSVGYIYVTPLIEWAPIEPITLKYFQNGKKLIKEEVYKYGF